MEGIIKSDMKGGQNGVSAMTLNVNGLYKRRLIGLTNEGNWKEKSVQISAVKISKTEVQNLH